MEYLVDTDWVIHYLNGHEGVQERLDRLAPSGIAVSAITLAEVYQGVFYSSDPEGKELQFMRFLAGCEVLGLNDTICRLFTQERGRLTAAVRVIGDDCGASRPHPAQQQSTAFRAYLGFECGIDNWRVASGKHASRHCVDIPCGIGKLQTCPSKRPHFALRAFARERGKPEVGCWFLVEGVTRYR